MSDAVKLSKGTDVLDYLDSLALQLELDLELAS